MAMKQNNFYLRWQKAAGAAKSESRSQACEHWCPALLSWLSACWAGVC